MIKRKLVHMNVHINLYNKVDEVRKMFNQVNGFEISLTEASNILSKNIKIPRIKNIIKNENKNKKR